jgi:hypothetical protein
MPLSPEEVAKDTVEIAAGRCPECHINLAGECVCGFLNPISGQKFCAHCGKALSGKPTPEGLVKHAASHWRTEAGAQFLGVDALRRWHLVTGYSA